MHTHYADKVRSILARRNMGKGKLGNVVAGKPKASGQDNKNVPMGSGEYVLPKEFVDHVGADNLDQMVQHTLGTLQPPSGSVKKGYRHGGRYQMYNTGGWGAQPQAQSNYQQVEVPT